MVRSPGSTWNIPYVRADIADEHKRQRDLLLMRRSLVSSASATGAASKVMPNGNGSRRKVRSSGKSGPP